MGLGAGAVPVTAGNADGPPAAAWPPDWLAPAAVHPASNEATSTPASHRAGPEGQDRHLDRPAANDRLGFDIKNNDDR